ncbi:Bug family tripartite tricarboxylate transporter substrate binding protein [Kerstersia similis]|uniref:Bug family tripartite tricarboxylate transporter substrate binding protein n=1 Tax=Kerstersia similis TaxID=206505 RepID=UPI0039EE040B
MKNTFTRRTLLKSLAAAPLVLTVSNVLAAEYPSKPINLIVWSGAGGSLDTYGRKLAELLSREMGWTVNVQNRPGGSGAVGVSAIMAQPADGYNILVLTGTLTFGIAQGLIPFPLDSMRLVRAMQAEPSSLAVRKDSPLQTVQDFVDYMKEHPNGLKVGGHAPAGFHQYVLFQLMQQGGFKSGWIPHDASGKIPLALLGGHIDVAVMTPSSGLDQVLNGDIRLLGVTTEERSAFFPEVPTFKEQGFDIVDSIWRGLAIKNGTPENIVETIQAAVDRVEASPDWLAFQEREKQENINLAEQGFTEMVSAQIAGQREFLKSIGLIK